MSHDDRREPPAWQLMMVFALAMAASAGVGSLVYLIAHIIPILQAAARALS
jgi:hypothetical protein